MTLHTTKIIDYTHSLPTPTAEKLAAEAHKISETLRARAWQFMRIGEAPRASAQVGDASARSPSPRPLRSPEQRAKVDSG